MNDCMLTTHVRSERLVQLVRADPGISRETIAVRMGLRLRQTSAPLQHAKHMGLIGSTQIDHGIFGWFPAELLEAAQKTWTKKRKELKSQRLAKRRAAAREAARQKTQEQPGDDSCDEKDKAPFVHRRVPAIGAGPLPFKCSAANSVFALGQR